MATTEKIRVMHILCSNQFSGAENVVCQIIHAFRQDEAFEMFYASPDGPISEALKERGVAFVPIETMTPSAVRRAIRKVKPSIVHAHDMRASFLAALVCKNIPLISHIHNNNFDSRKLSVKSLLYFFAAQKAKSIFWVSQSAYDGYLFHAPFKSKSHILYNVIDAEQIRKKADLDERAYAYDIVYVGRLTYQKNPQRFVGIVERVRGKYPALKAAVVGNGELEAELRKEIAARALDANIDLLGFRSNPYKIMREAKLLLMTSRWEGLPMCALEAMALGLPIVSTPTDGMNEVIENGKNGFLSEDDAALADRCCDIISKPELRAALSAMNLEKTRQLCDLDAYYKKIKNVYLKAMP